ncbi:MAG: hypothetical protein DRI34_05765 [Deltaproteobacteria bacterium]|nr:MAG: hypothetical protein DRI34_05765 [Deltaproteobacteria bacterium]
MNWSLDCSMMLAAVLPDGGSAASDRFFARLGEAELWVPALFWYELAGVLSRVAARAGVAVFS